MKERKEAKVAETEPAANDPGVVHTHGWNACKDPGGPNERSEEECADCGLECPYREDALFAIRNHNLDCPDAGHAEECASCDEEERCPHWIKLFGGDTVGETEVTRVVVGEAAPEPQPEAKRVSSPVERYGGSYERCWRGEPYSVCERCTDSKCAHMGGRTLSRVVRSEPSVERPLLVIPRAHWARIMGWTKAADGEVSGVGVLRVDGRKFVLDEVYLPIQECSSGGTELDGEDLARLVLDIHGRGKVIHFHWHSHAEMGVFWSGTDHQNMTSFSPEWMVGLVVNRKGENLACLCLHSPSHLLLDLPIEVKEDEEMIEACKRDVKERVKERHFASPFATGLPDWPSRFPVLGSLSFDDERFGESYGCRHVVSLDVKGGRK